MRAPCLRLSRIPIAFRRRGVTLQQRRDGAQTVRAVLGALEDLRIDVADPDRAMILNAAGSKARHSTSFGDAFVVALAQAERATVVTGDPDFRKVEHLIPV
jgi:uncharacterized protein